MVYRARGFLGTPGAVAEAGNVLFVPPRGGRRNAGAPRKRDFLTIRLSHGTMTGDRRGM